MSLAKLNGSLLWLARQNGLVLWPFISGDLKAMLLVQIRLLCTSQALWSDIQQPQRTASRILYSWRALQRDFAESFFPSIALCCSSAERWLENVLCCFPAAGPSQSIGLGFSESGDSGARLHFALSLRASLDTNFPCCLSAPGVTRPAALGKGCKFLLAELSLAFITLPYSDSSYLKDNSFIYTSWAQLSSLWWCWGCCTSEMVLQCLWEEHVVLLGLYSRSVVHSFAQILVNLEWLWEELHCSAPQGPCAAVCLVKNFGLLQLF